jgi:hypothetical protein
VHCTTKSVLLIIICTHIKIVTAFVPMNENNAPIYLHSSRFGGSDRPLHTQLPDRKRPG